MGTTGKFTGACFLCVFISTKQGILGNLLQVLAKGTFKRASWLDGVSDVLP